MPELEATRRVPVCINTNEPVPYVFLAIPSAVHDWPNKAACWSPAIPVMGAAISPRDLEIGRLVSATRYELAWVTRRHSASTWLDTPWPCTKSCLPGGRR